MTASPGCRHRHRRDMLPAAATVAVVGDTHMRLIVFLYYMYVRMCMLVCIYMYLPSSGSRQAPVEITHVCACIYRCVSIATKNSVSV